MHYRITNLVFPNAIVIPMSNEMTITQWHVPIDDLHCFWYSIFTSFGAAVDRETMRRTLHKVMRDWQWQDTWGWDFPMAAMTAAIRKAAWSSTRPAICTVQLQEEAPAPVAVQDRPPAAVSFLN